MVEEPEVQCGLSWVEATLDQLPSNLVDAGGGVYIIRVKNMESILPGMLDLESRKAYFIWNERVLETQNFQILCDTGLPVSFERVLPRNHFIK